MYVDFDVSPAVETRAALARTLVFPGPAASVVRSQPEPAQVSAKPTAPRVLPASPSKSRGGPARSGPARIGLVIGTVAGLAAVALL